MQNQRTAVDPEVKAPLCSLPLTLPNYIPIVFLSLLSSSELKTEVAESAISISNSQTWKSCLS